MKPHVIALQLAAILLLTALVTADENPYDNILISADIQNSLESSESGPSNAGPIESSREEMIAPFSKVSKDDFLLDVSEGTTQYLDGAVSIPYSQFLADKKPKPMDEISKILRDAGVPCDRPIYVYGECAPCGHSFSPASFVFLILDSLGYQAILLEGTIEELAASGGQTSDRPAIKPKTNCTPANNSRIDGGKNKTQIEIGNGSKTDEGFAGIMTSQTINQNESTSEGDVYAFKANSTPDQEVNDTVKQFENASNESIDINSEDFYEDPHHSPFRWRHYLQDVSRHGFYKRYGRVLREHALSGEPFSQYEMDRMNSDWDRVQRRYAFQPMSFWEMLRGVLFAKANRPQDSLKINTPNAILGARG